MSTEAKRPPAPAQKQKEKGAPSDNGADASVNDLAETTPELRRELLHSMLLQRRFEERCAEAYALGKIGGVCPLYIGQEGTRNGAVSTPGGRDYGTKTNP